MKPKGHLRIPEVTIPLWWPSMPFNCRTWLPSRGNVLFTLVMVVGLLWASSAGAFPFGMSAAVGTSTGTIAYQGRLADSSGNPITATVPVVFRLYNTASRGTSLWEEQWTGSNSVRVSDGLFNVMLGSLTTIPQSIVTGNANLWLGITVNADDEMQPRVQLGSVPFAVQALTVPDGSISTTKLADGSVTLAKLDDNISLVPPDGSITTAKIAPGSVTQYQAALGATGASVTASSAFQDVPGRSVTLTTTGGPVFALFSDSDLASVAGSVGYWQIIRDDSVVIAFNNNTFDSTSWKTVMFFGIDVPPAGTHTYKVQWRVNSGTLSSSAGVYSQNFTAIEFKR